MTSEKPARAHPLERATLNDHHDIELILVRHGQQIPSSERSGSAEHRDPPLSAIGERQIEAVGDHLAGEEITAVYASPLVRARRTGEAIAARHGLEPTLIDDLREIETMQLLPDGKKPGQVVDPLIWAGAGERFVQTGKWDEFPLSESSAHFRRRCSRAIEAAVAAERTGRIVVACHGGVINTYIAEQLGIDRDYWFKAGHCSISRIFVHDTRRVVWNINETHHLSGDLFTT